MIDRQGRMMTLVCDDCDDTLDREFSKDDFLDMISYARGEGWKVKKDDSAEGGFTHRCETCAVSGKLEAQRKLLGL